MQDFESELNKLLAEEGMQPSHTGQDEITAIINAGRELLLSFNKKQNDISLQIEEIYDLAKDADDSTKALLAEKEKSNRLLRAALNLTDIIEDFYTFAHGNPELEGQAGIMWKNSGAILETCSVSRLGAVGQQLDPSVHSVQGTEKSELPHEHVSRVLQYGYSYMGVVLRKAAVIISSEKN